MTKKHKKALRLLIETFWEFESGWGARPQEQTAARNLQRMLGYKTRMDKARKV